MVVFILRRERIRISAILLFLIFLPYASSEEFAPQAQLPSPGTLVLPLGIAGDSNASGKAIIASSETAKNIMGNSSEDKYLGDQEALGLLPVAEEINADGVLKTFETMDTTAPTQSLAEETRIASVLETSENKVTILLQSKEYNITKDADGFDVVDMNDFYIKYITGEPMLPSCIANVLLPPDANISSVKLEVISEKTRLLDGTYNIRPSPEPRISASNDTYDSSNQNPDVRSAVYLNNTLYPKENILLMPYSQMRKWIFVPIQFIPFKYNPVQKTLTLIENATVIISYDLQPALSAETSDFLNDAIMDDLAPGMFVNYDELKDSYRAQPYVSSAPSATGRYVIITTNAIKSGSTKLNAFIAHKQSLGYTVSVVTETDFGGLTGQAPNHKAEKIRQWLKNNYVSLGIKYVLLIGNPSPYESTEGDIPMKMCWPRPSSTYPEAPTDAFYADLTGNWNIDSDAEYGEWSDFAASGGVDFTPEVYVGRIPVYGGDYTTLDSILQKTIDYETSSSTSWRKSALLPMGFQDSSPTDGAYLAEQMKNDYLSSNGYTCYRMYQQGNGACALDSSKVSEAELRGGYVVRDRWRDNDYGIVAWWGHGWEAGAIVGYDDPSCRDGNLFTSVDCSSLDNAHPSFTYQCSCTNGHPETTNNLQYSILKKGGIATVSATRVSWYIASQTDHSSPASNSGICYQYVKRLVQELPAANALLQTKSSMPPSLSYILMNYYVFNIYGDPSVSIKSPTEPAAWTSLGGYTTYKHNAIMDNQGRRHVFVVGGDNALWDNMDGSWIRIGGSITSTPYSAKDKFGRIHIVVRGADYALWDYIFDTESWTGGWRGLGGYLTSSATAAMEPTYGNYMKIVIRGGDNSLWLCDFNVNDLSSYNWVSLGGRFTSWPFIIFDANSRLHILVRGGDNGLWDNRGVLSSGSYAHNWHGLGGVITEPPFATLEPGQISNIAAMVRGSDNALWMANIYALGNPETCTWYRLGGVISSDAFAATDSANRIHTFVRGSDGTMWENVFSSSPWNPSEALWIGHGGYAINGWSPQALIGSQTYAYVLGGDKAIWSRVYTTSVASASSSEAEAFGKSDSQVKSEGVVAGGTGTSIPMS